MRPDGSRNSAQMAENLAQELTRFAPLAALALLILLCAACYLPRLLAKRRAADEERKKAKGRTDGRTDRFIYRTLKFCF